MARKLYEDDGVIVEAQSDITAGDVVVVDNIAGVAAANAATGRHVWVYLQGTFAFPKPQGFTASVDDAVYWTGSAITTTAQNNTKLGRYRGETPEGDVLVVLGK